MRFCMVTTFYPPYHFGGDAIFVQSLARALVAAGHHVEVVHCEDAYRLQHQPSPSPIEEQNGVVVHRLRSPAGLLSPVLTQQTGKPGLKARALRAIFDRHFDVVNFHNISLVGGPGILGMSHAPVNVYTLHEHWLICPMHSFWKNNSQACDGPQCLQCCLRSGIPPQLWRYTNLIQRSFTTIDAVFSPSRYTADRHREFGLTVPIHVLPTFSSMAGPRPGKASSSPRRIFLYVGRVTASKGIAWLLQEFAALPQYELLVVGTGDLLPTLRERYAGMRHIRFLGSLTQDQLSPLYQEAVALILPSLAPEVFPLTILEAFAHETPVIVHDAGGSREAVDQTGGGWVYDTREEFHTALAALADDGRLRAELGRRGRKGYETYYTQNRYVTQYLEFINGVIRNKRHTSLMNRHAERHHA